MPSLLNELIELAITNEDPALLAEACLTLRGEGATIATIGFPQMGEASDTKGTSSKWMSCLAL